MNRWMMAVSLLFFATVGQAASPSDIQYLPMPPVFSLDANADQLLKEYPLGVITKEAAFAHHGQAHNVVTLPNGLEGWVYENSLTKQETFSMSSGQKRETQALEHTCPLHLYARVRFRRQGDRRLVSRQPSRRCGECVAHSAPTKTGRRKGALAIQAQGNGMSAVSGDFNDA